MAYLKLDKKKLEHNYKILDAHFKSHQVEWATVSKILCGNKPFLKELINLGTKEICDSRISNLQKIKEIESDLTVGRVLVRASGTESKIRVMVESDDATTASKYAKDIAEMFAS